MNYEDAMEYLRIAENAFDVQAYEEAAEITEKVAHYAAYGCEELSPEQKTALVDAVQRAIGRFTFCPDECLWEEISALSDLFRD